MIPSLSYLVLLDRRGPGLLLGQLYLRQSFVLLHLSESGEAGSCMETLPFEAWVMLMHMGE